jgi:pyruvate dehydrogenase E1 component beta subunit
VVREGKHATVIALGRMVGGAEEAAEALAAEGIQVTIIDPRTTSPSTPTRSSSSPRRRAASSWWTRPAPLRHGRRHRRADRRGGLRRAEAPILKVTPPHTPVPYAPSLEDAYIPDAARIADAVRRVVAHK